MTPSTIASVTAVICCHETEPAIPNERPLAVEPAAPTVPTSTLALARRLDRELVALGDRRADDERARRVVDDVEAERTGERDVRLAAGAVVEGDRARAALHVGLLARRHVDRAVRAGVDRAEVVDVGERLVGDEVDRRGAGDRRAGLRLRLVGRRRLAAVALRDRVLAEEERQRDAVERVVLVERVALRCRGRPRAGSGSFLLGCLVTTVPATAPRPEDAAVLGLDRDAGGVRCPCRRCRAR